MTDKQLILPLYIKLLLFIGDWFVIIGLYFSLLSIIFLSFDIEFEENKKLELLNTIIPVVILLSTGLIRTIKRIKIIETSNAITRGIFSGEIVFPLLKKYSNKRLLLRLSLEIQSKISGEKITKHFYFVKSQLSFHQNNYILIFNEDNPRLAILMNSLPGLVRKYISKWESTIANSGS